jgi:hypothetical protein
MEQAIEAQFSCGGCGKSFRWKPAIAGKKAQCACGTMIAIPVSGAARSSGTSGPKVAVNPAAPARKIVPVTNVVRRVAPVSAGVKAAPAAAPIRPPPLPAVDEDAYGMGEDDISQLGSLLPSAEAIAAAEREIPAVIAAPVKFAAPLEYRRAEKVSREPRIDPNTGEFSDPIRDYVAPAVLLVASFASLAAYVIFEKGSGPLVGVVIYVAFGIMLGVTVFKTVVLTMAAVPVATYCDVGIGLLRTAILKLAATILFGDICIFWLVVAMQAGGMISKKDDGVWVINVVVLTVVYQVCFWYLFRLSAVDLKFAALMSFFSRLCNFFLMLVLLGLITSLAARHAQPSASSIPAIRAAPVIAPGTPVTVQPGNPGPTVLDERISARIRQHPFQILEGYAWARTGAADDADKKLISDLYGAGADKVYVYGFNLYALLPADSLKRDKCAEVAHRFRADNHMRDSAGMNAMNYQYLIVDLIPERFKGRRPGN